MKQGKIWGMLDYCSETGVFRWKKPRRGIKAGAIAGSKNTRGYIQIMINYKPYQGHRLAWLYVYGEVPGEIDHINGDPSDNRISNLRSCSHAENMRNAKRMKNNTSGVKGVSWDERNSKWRVQIHDGEKNVLVGRFGDLETAAVECADARLKLHRDFTNHGDGVTWG